jgi:hypothetical protein
MNRRPPNSSKFRTIVRNRKEAPMLLTLLSALAVVAVGRTLVGVYRLWRAVPRRNADFGIV